jgi:hypothetical protein
MPVINGDRRVIDEPVYLTFTAGNLPGAALAGNSSEVQGSSLPQED